MGTNQPEKEKRVLSIMTSYQMVATIEALENAGATLELLKLVRGNKDFAKVIIEAGITFLESFYPNDETESEYGYPDGYVIKSLSEQIESTVCFFDLEQEDYGNAMRYACNLPELPSGAEGWFAIPKWQAIARTYGEAVEKMLSLLGHIRPLENWREDHLGEKYLRQSERSERMFATICEQQMGNIILFPAQFGLSHRGRSTRRARKVFVDNEFGLGAFSSGCMLLTHSKREQVDFGQIHIDCPGDEYISDGGSGPFVCAPSFFFNTDKIHFQVSWVGGTNSQSAPASGFIF